MAYEITIDDIHSMVTHWLNTPINGYLGSGYGADYKALLLEPMSGGMGDDFIRKMKNDIPILSTVEGLNVYQVDSDIDKKTVVVDVLGKTFNVGGG